MTEPEGVKGTSRIEAFSDGVFAIAITLLILEIKVPAMQPGQTLLSSVMHEWPSFLALLIGFMTLLICWINHHYMFTMINRSNSVLMLVNGFKLLIVTLTPFATALLAKNFGTEWEHQAVSMYCLNFAFMGISMGCIWSYALKRRFATHDSKRKLQLVTQLYIFAGIISTLIWMVSYLSVIASLLLSTGMFAVFIFPEKVIQWRLKKVGEVVSA